jgi:hypothetical protein
MRATDRPYCKIRTNLFGHCFLGYFKVVAQSVPRLEAVQGALLAYVDLMPELCD